jgi:uncharacterized DUF497 family protein
VALEFEWDRNKAAKGAATVFSDPLGRIIEDPKHSADEERSVLLGSSRKKRLLAVMFTEREERIRIISARPATPRERRDDEQSPQ